MIGPKKKCRMTKIFYRGPDSRVGKVVARLSRKDRFDKNDDPLA